uniref:Small ribosomal subunit protein uS3m n=1 Tax=Hannaella oryzae TaxID=4979 RepID=A0A385JEZ2_9TREE|nr:ribosomal protein S3 [Hannaella oryzae]AXY96238.1 ribosomal protein S3 [Hannaella oryzae]
MKNILTQSLAKYYLPGGNMLVTSHNYDKKAGSANMLNATRSAMSLINHFFSPIQALAGKPVFTVSANSVVVHVFYYIPAADHALNSNTVNNLGEALSSIFGRPVELRLVKLHYPYLDGHILAQFIALNTQDYTLAQILRRVFGSISPVKNIDSANVLASDLPSHIVGIKVRVSGRLMMERSRPRQTVQTQQIGSFSKDNLALVDSASFTTKNKKGAFTVKVWISQRAVV